MQYPTPKSPMHFRQFASQALNVLFGTADHWEGARDLPPIPDADSLRELFAVHKGLSRAVNDNPYDEVLPVTRHDLKLMLDTIRVFTTREVMLRKKLDRALQRSLN